MYWINAVFYEKYRVREIVISMKNPICRFFMDFDTIKNSIENHIAVGACVL